MTDWQRPDLTLLLPLHALLTERNVTRAAERLAMSQPSMSLTLAKLRRHFDDPLLVREGRSMALTPLAESLRTPLQEVLKGARDVLSPMVEEFDPAVAERTFMFVASDYVATILLRPALRELTAAGPGLQMKCAPLQAEVVEALRSKRCDLVFWPLQLADPEWLTFPHEVLFTDQFVLVADKDNALMGDAPLTQEQFSALSVVQVLFMDDQRAIPQVRLAEQRIAQSVAATVPTFTLALQMVAGSNLVTMVHRRLAEEFGPALGLRVVPTDFELPKVTVAMFWHPLSTQLPAHAWIRGLLKRTAAGIAPQE